VCALPRGHLGDGGKVYRVTSHWEVRSKPFTQEFEAFAVTMTPEMRFNRSGLTLGLNDLGMYIMRFDYLKAGDVRLSFDSLVWV
jgi:hypothetical protein